MRATPLTVYEPAGDEARLDAAEQRAAQKWRRLVKRVRSTAPTDVLRGVLILAAGYAIWWLTWSTWPALLPFVVGGVVGYAVLPIVNALDRFLPRTLAALLTMAGVAAVLVSILGVLLPALAQQLYRLYEALPGLDDLRSAVAQVRQVVSGLPPPVQDFINTDVSPRVAT